MCDLKDVPTRICASHKPAHDKAMVTVKALPSSAQQPSTASAWRTSCRGRGSGPRTFPSLPPSVPSRRALARHPSLCHSGPPPQLTTCCDGANLGRGRPNGPGPRGCPLCGASLAPARHWESHIRDINERRRPLNKPTDSLVVLSESSSYRE